MEKGLVSYLRGVWLVLLLVAFPAAAQLLPLPMTPDDFHVPGTQTGDVPPGNLIPPNTCKSCHGGSGWDEQDKEIFATWAGSLMALGGKDPLYLAQVASANKDVAGAGSFCNRCHLPVAVVSGHVEDADGSTLDSHDTQGITCHVCHAMVDPVYKPGISPIEDQAILAALAEVPEFTANAMFVLDPEPSRRRGPRTDTQPVSHQVLVSPFHRDSALCGTCHDVGNVAVSRQTDGSYRYNAIGEESPSHDPAQQFPLERTYSEWKLSAFAVAPGVDMGGRFGGTRGPVVSTCQDCHMPGDVGAACTGLPGCVERPDLAVHAFAGAAVPALDLIAALDDPALDPDHIAAGRARALDMLQRAASIELERDGEDVLATVVNQTGHKLPTGHIEGRRVWLSLRFLDADDTVLGETGAYDLDTQALDTASTTVYEMHLGLSDDAAAVTGLDAGPTTRMSLADTIVKDTRIPPRGFNNAAFAAAGAPVVGITYADGQYSHTQRQAIPAGTDHIEAALWYQSLPRAYIEALRDGDPTGTSPGEILHTLWEQTGKGAPIPMATASMGLGEHVFADDFETRPQSPRSGLATVP